MENVKGKVCSTCKKHKSFKEFYKDKSKKDGMKYQCKECVLESQKHSEPRKEWQKKYYKENYNYNVRKEYLIQYRKDNPDYAKRNAKKYNETENGKESRYKAKMKRRSYKHYVKFTPHQRKGILDRDNWTCQSCGCKVHDEKVNNETKAHIDHIVPISRGGNSEPSNLQVLCRTCNLSKSDKILV